MLITAAVVPGPAAIVAELMGSAAHELDDLRDAADRVISRALADLLAASAGPVLDPVPSLGPGSGSVQLVVVGSGPPGEFNAVGPVSFASFGLDVVVPALVEGQPGDAELPTPIMVARYLASRDIAAHPEHAQLWSSARWITTTGGDATALGRQLGADVTVIGLVLVADGAACHGPKAPRAQDVRAQAYDDSVSAALASGQPSRLAQIDVDLGDELGATGSQVWPVLVEAAGAAASAGAAHAAGFSDPADVAVAEGSARWDGVGELLWAGAPYGVGYAVASWRRSCR